MHVFWIRRVNPIDFLLPAETSHLIGQWLPVNASNSTAALQPRAKLLLQRLVKLAISQALLGFHSCSSLPSIIEQLQHLLAAIPSSWKWTFDNSSEQSDVSGSGLNQQHLQLPDQTQLLTDDQLAGLLDEADMLLLLMSEEQLQLPREVQGALDHLKQHLGGIRRKMEDIKPVQGLAFAWVESQLVAAVKEGHWVSGSRMFSRCPLLCYIRYSLHMSNHARELNALLNDGQ